jgi:hypothetical protein
VPIHGSPAHATVTEWLIPAEAGFINYENIKQFLFVIEFKIL